LGERYGGWEIVGAPLGEGGQGMVYKARSPQRVAAREDSIRRLENLFRQLSNEPKIEELVTHVMNIGAAEDPKNLGALKVFTIPKDNSRERDQAIARLQAEMKAMQELDHPSVLRLLQGCHLNADKHFIVTEYHANGTLADHLDRYKGRALEALQAFRPLVNAVSAIHGRPAIHRDIKPQNIFIASDGRLVLGDFGIVFFGDQQRTRLTGTYGEIVGSHFWMAPWAYVESRLPIDAVKPSLDLFPLGKVLWSMVAGRNGFPFWEYTRNGNNLESLFPGDPAMPTVNKVVGKCVVRDESECVTSAADLLGWIDSAIEHLRSSGEKPEDSRQPWPCNTCGKGRYVKQAENTFMQMASANGAITGSRRLEIYVCDHCHHAELFSA
jgi:serine/threonine protein kinase